MLQCLACNLHAAQHPGKFLDAFVLCRGLHPRARGLAIGDLADAKVLVREAGNLRQVSYAQDLPARAKFLQLRPTISATPPPTPLSTSSNTMVGMALPSLAMTWIERLMRDNSPPDAILASDCGAWPGLALIRNSMLSMPQGFAASSASVVDCYLENAAGHTETVHCIRDSSLETRGRFARLWIRHWLVSGIQPWRHGLLLQFPAALFRMTELVVLGRSLSDSSGSSSALTRCLREIVWMASRRSSTQSRRAGSMSRLRRSGAGYLPPRPPGCWRC